MREAREGLEIGTEPWRPRPRGWIEQRLRNKRDDLHENELFVVIIAGEPETPGVEYRVVRLADAVRRSGHVAVCIRSQEILSRTTDFSAADVLIIWRMPWDERLASAVRLARRSGAKIIFDIDDAMIDPDLARPEIIDAIRFQKFDPNFLRGLFTGMLGSLLACDFCTTTTSELAFHARKHGLPTFIVPNSYDRESLQRSRSEVRKRTPDRVGEIVRLGYASGSRTHQRDFAIIAPLVARMLKENPRLRLVLFREGGSEGLELTQIDEFPDLRDVAGSIEWRDLCPLEDLPYELARFDINLAPLEEGNVFCEAKSELKYFEAALASVPTVASPTGPFRRAICSGLNGILCSTPDDWEHALTTLVADPGERYRIGKSALHDARWRFGPRHHSLIVGNVLQQITASNRAAAAAFEKSLQPNLIRTPPAMGGFDVIINVDHLRPCAVAVIIPNFNYAHFIEEALDSVHGQTLQHIEIVVVDDGSEDNSASVIAQWLVANSERFSRTTYVQNRVNSGLAQSRNAGIWCAEAEYVLMLDSDNRLRPTCCEKLLAAIESEGAEFAYPSVRKFGDDCGLVSESAWSSQKLVAGNYVDALALIAKDAWVAAGGYLDIQGGWEDFDLWCRFAERGFYGVHVDQELAEYRVHARSMIRTQTDLLSNKRRLIDQAYQSHPWLSLVEEGLLQSRTSWRMNVGR